MQARTSSPFRRWSMSITVVLAVATLASGCASSADNGKGLPTSVATSLASTSLLKTSTTATAAEHDPAAVAMV